MAIKRKKKKVKKATKRKVASRTSRKVATKPKGRVAASKRVSRPGKRPSVRKPALRAGRPTPRPGGKRP
tara:strand:- start:233 stop:439 length:207 start_codon:yes stop_codon:yes gene_type:complete